MRPPLGIFTTDDRLVVRTWDDWLAGATGIPASQALHRPIAEVLPDIRTRGLLPVFDAVLTRGTSEVLATAFHHFLFPCPPSEPSASFTHMQQHVTIGPLRDERRVIGVMVTVEDVTARIERERQLGERLRQEQAEAAAVAAREGGAAPPRDAATLARLLGQDDWRARQEAVATLAPFSAQIVDALVQTLREQHDDFSVLSSALDLLAASEIDVVEPLIRFLEQGEPNLRMQAALILGERRDRRAIAPLIAGLNDPDVNVRFHVIEALGRLHATEAAEALTAIAEERDFFLAFPAIQALTRLGSASVAPRLVPLLADDLLRAPVIDVLGELGDEDVTAPLVTLLNASDAPPDVIAAGLSGLHDRYDARYGAGAHIADIVRRTITATGTQRLLDAVQQLGPDRLPGIARVLGWLEGEAVQRALTRLLGQQSVRSQVVEALVRHGAGVVALLSEQLGAEDLETRQAAAIALGRIGDRRATPALMAALDDREVAVAAAGALARIGSADAYEPLIARLGDPDPSIRQAVIGALNSIGHPAMPARVVQLLDDADPVVRESALKIAGYFGYRECLDRVLAHCADQVEAVRRTAVEHLVFYDDARIYGALAAALRDPAPVVRAAAVAALARADDPSRVAWLLGALDDPDPWVRYIALRSIAATGAAHAVPAVVARLQDDSAPHVRLAAIDAIGRLRPDGALGMLQPIAQGAQEDMARAAILALGHVDGDDALSVIETIAAAAEPWRRLAAVDALVLRREARVPAILQWMAAADAAAEVSGLAVDALARLGARDGEQGAGAARALIALGAEAARRSAAIIALSALPPRRVPDIAAGLSHPSTDVRRACIEALGRMKHPDASRALEAALDDGEAAVRLAAVAELKHLGIRSAQKKLMALARTDTDPDVRHAAMMAVARSDHEGGRAPAR